MSEGASLGTLVVRGSLITMVRTLTVYAGGGLAILVLSHRLIPSEYVYYAVALAWLSGVASLVAGGGAVAFVRDGMTADREEIHETASLLVAILLPVVTLVLALMYLALKQNELVLAASLCAYVLLMPLRLPALVSCYSRLRFSSLALLEGGEAAAFNLTAVAGVWFGLGVLAIPLAVGVAATVAVLIALTVHPWRPSAPTLSGLAELRRIAPYSLNSLLASLRDALTLPLLALTTSAAVAGLYGWALPLAAASLITLHIGAGPLFSAFVRLSGVPELLADSAHRGARLILTSVFAISTTIAVVAPLAITVIFSDKWSPAVDTLRLLCAGAALWGVGQTLHHLIVTRSGGISAANRWAALNLAVLWGAGLPLAYSFGSAGLALAFVLGRALVTFFSLRYVQQHYGLNLLSDLGAMAIASAAAAVAGLGLKDALPSNLNGLMIASIGTLGFFTVALFSLRGRVLRSDLALVWHHLKS